MVRRAKHIAARARGALVVPGHYTVEMTLAGRTLSKPLDVAPDPRARSTGANYAPSHAFVTAPEAKFSEVDVALNRLDASASSAAAQGLQVNASRARAIRGDLTADYQNDEDSIGRPGKLREALQDFIGFGAASGPPSPPTLELAARIEAIMRRRWLRSRGSSQAT